MTDDLRVLVLTALVDGPLPRYLPPELEGSSIERVLRAQEVRDTIGIARTLGEMQSGPWPLVERTDYGSYRLTVAGAAHLDWHRWSEQVAAS